MEVFLDLETRSHCDIKACGGNVYARHESTELLVGAAVVRTGGRCVVYVWGPHACLAGARYKVPKKAMAGLGIEEGTLAYLEPEVTEKVVTPFLLSAHSEGATFIAHNGEGFDRPLLEAHGLPTDARWVDTQHRARQSGLPAGLDAIGSQLFDVGKDEKGKKSLSILMKPHKNTGEFVAPRKGPLTLVTRYCVLDVLLMMSAWDKEGWACEHPDDAVRETHIAMDRRGLRCDTELAKMLYDESERLKEEQLDAVETAGVARSVVTSPKQLGEWLSVQGFAVEDVQKNTMKQLLDCELPSLVRQVVEARLAVNRVTQGKALAALNSTCPDGRMRGTIVYWGAHTGRWAGRLFQTQNLTAPVKGFSESAYDVGVPAMAANLEVQEEEILASMLRGIIVAEEGRALAMIDYSQIEARVLPWMAEDDETLQVFRDGKDIYRVTAARMYAVAYETLLKESLERLVGKVSTLALGYQGAVGALDSMAKNNRLNLAEEGIDPETTVNKWRDANPLIAGVRSGLWTTPEGRQVVVRKGGLWKGIQAAAVAAIKGQPNDAARCHFRMIGPHLYVFLPSGRPLVYRGAKYIPWEDSWGGVKPAITFLGVRYGKVNREATYGGRLCENICQAIARDVMGHAMIRLEAEGLNPLFTVHDEIIADVADEAEGKRVCEIMEQTPAWAPGLPLKAEGGIGGRYGK